jgi:hypothetical protein
VNIEVFECVDNDARVARYVVVLARRQKRETAVTQVLHKHYFNDDFVVEN